MQIKIDFQCQDSILAAPLALDLILLLDLAKRAGLSNVHEWLSFYFKSPMCRAGNMPQHDLFVQHRELLVMLQWLAGRRKGRGLAGDGTIVTYDGQEIRRQPRRMAQPRARS